MEREERTQAEQSREFGAKLRRLRREKRLSQKVLAERVGVSIRTLINYEQGVSQPRRQSVLRRLADEFEVSVDYLLRGDQVEQELESYNWSGWHGPTAVEDLVSHLTTLFAGGYLSESDRDAAMEAISQAYWESRRSERAAGREGAPADSEGRE